MSLLKNRAYNIEENCPYWLGSKNYLCAWLDMRVSYFLMDYNHILFDKFSFVYKIRVNHLSMILQTWDYWLPVCSCRIASMFGYFVIWDWRLGDDHVSLVIWTCFIYKFVHLAWHCFRIGWIFSLTILLTYPSESLCSDIPGSLCFCLLKFFSASLAGLIAILLCLYADSFLPVLYISFSFCEFFNSYDYFVFLLFCFVKCWFVEGTETFDICFSEDPSCWDD